MLSQHRKTTAFNHANHWFWSPKAVVLLVKNASFGSRKCHSRSSKVLFSKNDGDNLDFEKW